MNPPHLQTRSAQAQDVQQIYQLMLPFMLDKTLISRDEDDIYEHLQEFVIVTNHKKVCGVAALHIYSPHLAEIRSLVVSQQSRSLGIGSLLVQACEDLAQQLGVSCVFALTYVDKFFTQRGYSIVAKESLPQKVWTVCIHCPKFSSCDEIAVQKGL